MPWSGPGWGSGRGLAGGRCRGSGESTATKTKSAANATRLAYDDLAASRTATDKNVRVLVEPLPALLLDRTPPSQEVDHTAFLAASFAPFPPIEPSADSERHVETNRARHALELDVTDFGERHRRPRGRVDHFLADENLARPGVVRDPSGDVHRAAEVVTLVENDRPGVDPDMGGWKGVVSIPSLMSRAATTLPPASGK